MCGEKFEGAKILYPMGVAWFVSYAYYENIDSSHRNWENVSSIKSKGCKLSRYKNSRKYHKLWLSQVELMREGQLNRNKIGLSATRVKEMAKEILNKGV